MLCPAPIRGAVSEAAAAAAAAAAIVAEPSHRTLRMAHSHVKWRPPQGCVTVVGSATVVGCVQVTRGALNTPEAIVQRRAGKVWDEDTCAEG